MGRRRRIDAFSVEEVAPYELATLRLRDLEDAFDYDAPRRRLALVYWRPDEGRWCVERGGGRRDWSALHVEGELLFGPSPWRRACVILVFGRLGSVEAAVAALPAPGPAFGYEYEWEFVESKGRTSMRAKRAPRMWDAAEAAYFEGVANVG